jgi:anaerobic magnesium-protoporphyrin IX monomethyl ester cyclase
MADVVLFSLFDEFALGPRTLKSVLEKAGHPVCLVLVRSAKGIDRPHGSDRDRGHHIPPVELTGEELRLVVDLVRRERPRLVGFSAISSVTGLAFRLIEEIRAAWEAPVIMGGCEPTVCPEFSLQRADLVCRGEGEGLMLELMDRLKRGEDHHDLQNLAFLRDGELVSNPLRPLIQDLDSLPDPDFSGRGTWLLDDNSLSCGVVPEGSTLHANVMWMVSRGCPLSCAYCCNSAFRSIYPSGEGAPYHRHCSVDRALEGLRRVTRQGSTKRHVIFQDDVFPPSMEWLAEFGPNYREQIGLPFVCYIHPNLCDAETLCLLKEAGADYLKMGVQSASERTLREDFHRAQDNERALELAWHAHRLDLPMVIDLMCCNPWETEEDHRATLEFILRLPRDSVHISITYLLFLGGYPITERARRTGVPLVPGPPGTDYHTAPRTPEGRFWKALLHLAQAPHLALESLRVMANDPHLRRHPEILEQLEAMHVDLAYLPDSCVTKDKVMAELGCELAAYHGSRAHRLVERLRRWSHRDGRAATP